ncbi:MAG: hypothetical protein HZB76_05910 [Chlamydiae bacterium]|nr:hypothetical protein [Chlamydiota bacterium]
MASKVLFNTNIFNNYETLQDFMEGKNQIKTINAQTASAADVKTSLAKKVALIAISPFCLIASLFFYICSFPLSLVFADNLSTKCKVLSFYFFHYAACIKTIPLFGKNLLVLTNNMNALSTSDLYLTKKIERKSISKDERMIELIYSKLIENWRVDEANFKNLCQENPHWDANKIREMRTGFNELFMRRFIDECSDIKFVNFSGLRLGMSAWFAFLYLNSDQSNQDSLKHIVAVAKQFENGAPREAGLLQSLFGVDGSEDSFAKLLKLQKGERIHKNLSGKDSLDCFKFLNKMENGVYFVYLIPHNGPSGQGMCFIKEGEHKYIFDPNVGLLNIDDEKTFQTFYNSNIRNYHGLIISKLMKEAPLIQVPKKPSEAPKGILFRAAHKISHLFSKKAA